VPLDVDEPSTSVQHSGCVHYYGLVPSHHVLDELQQVGFSSQEARVYIGLLKAPSTTGYELAKTTGLQRANVYQVLASLAARGAIEQTGAEPARFTALSPAEVLGRIKRDTSRRCDSLIAELTAIQPERPAEGFWSIRSREAVIDRASSLVAEARDSVAVSLWADDLEWFGSALSAASRSGLRVIANVFGETDLDLGMVFQHEAPNKTVGGHVLTLSTDGTTAMVATLDEPAGGLYTSHPALVRVVDKLLRDEAYLAAIFERLGPELEVAFGPHLVHLRSQLLPPDDAAQLLSVVGFGANQRDHQTL
jgi:HTH-type transcriptional regulator, sugar sensing transcriptional regulator